MYGLAGGSINGTTFTRNLAEGTRYTFVANTGTPESLIPWQEERVTLSSSVKWDAVEVGAAVDVDNIFQSGLHTQQPTSKLFIRKACIDLFSFLDSSNADKMVHMVEGCPGIGKSVEVYSYAVWYAETKGKRLLYINGDVLDGFSVMFKDRRDSVEARFAHMEEFIEQPEVLLRLIRSLYKEDKVDMIVLDGELTWLIEKVYFKLGRKPKVRLVTCTCFRAIRNISQEAYDESASMATFTMDSWNKDEYHAAVCEGALVLPSETTVEELFFYAGGCARVFNWNIIQMTQFLQESALSGVKNIEGIVGPAFIADNSYDAVGSLRAFYGGSSIAVSEYVMLQLIHRAHDCNCNFITRARSTMPNNTVWQGWVTKLTFWLMVRHGLALVFRNDKGSEETWGCARPVLEFKDANDEVLNNTECGYFLPSKWNQPLFDALYRVSATELRVIIITDDKRPPPSASCSNLGHLIPYIEAMNICTIDFVFVCRQDNLKAFQLPTPSTAALEAALRRQLPPATVGVARTSAAAVPAVPATVLETLEPRGTSSGRSSSLTRISSSAAQAAGNAISRAISAITREASAIVTIRKVSFEETRQIKDRRGGSSCQIH